MSFIICGSKTNPGIYLWDINSGQCVKRISNGDIFYNLSPNKKKIILYNRRTHNFEYGSSQGTGNTTPGLPDPICSAVFISNTYLFVHTHSLKENTLHKFHIGDMDSDCGKINVDLPIYNYDMERGYVLKNANEKWLFFLNGWGELKAFNYQTKKLVNIEIENARCIIPYTSYDTIISSENNIYMWNSVSNELSDLYSSKNKIYAIAISPNKNNIAIHSKKNIDIFDINTFTLIDTININICGSQIYYFNYSTIIIPTCKDVNIIDIPSKSLVIRGESPDMKSMGCHTHVEVDKIAIID